MKEFKGSSELREINHYETLNDISISCTAALDILNDLLCFEKLESGILDLHKLEVAVLPFIHDCAAMFAVQAREANITMKIVTNGDDSDFHGNIYQGNTEVGMRGCANLYINDNMNDEKMNNNSDNLSIDKDVSAIITGSDLVKSIVSVTEKIQFLPLETTDVVFMDKFKMDQVIRNLISNALKFTPRDGLITVTASFVPSENLKFNESNGKDEKIVDTRASSGRTMRTSWSGSFNYLYGTYGLLLGGVEGSVRHRKILPVRSMNSTERVKRNISENLPSERIVSERNKNKKLNFLASNIDGSDEYMHSVKNFTSNDLNPTEKAYLKGTSRKNGRHGPRGISGKLVITVEDSGAGISEENQQRLFKEIIQFNPEILQVSNFD